MLVQSPLASRKKSIGPRAATMSRMLSCWDVVNVENAFVTR